MDHSSGVGVLDKAADILAAIADRPLTLADLAESTSLPRPTAHRLAVALEHHRLLSRDDGGRFHLGPWLAQLAAHGVHDRLLRYGQSILMGLRDTTGFSAQLYRLEGDKRRCVAAVEPVAGLRDTVPVGALLTMSAGSAAQILAAWGTPTIAKLQLFAQDELAEVRDRGWAWSASQREPGVASLSAPVLADNGVALAAISVSGPEQRFSHVELATLGNQVTAAASHLQRLVLGQ